MRSYAATLSLAFTFGACAPVKSPSRTDAQSGFKQPAGTTTVTNEQNNGSVSSASGISSVHLTGRQVDLYAIRAGDAKVFLPPEFDKLPCSYFRQGQEFDIPAVPGGPPITLKGPVQNFYSGKWVRETEYLFKLSVYKRIYRDPGIPDWLTDPPTSRVQEYVLKLFDVVISKPTSETCSISARALN